MDADDRFADAAADLPDAMPERWETAIEDLAQAVALGLDRAQDLADAINDVLRTRPVVARAVGAAVVGALIGSFIASKTMPRPKSSVEVVREAARDTSAAAVDQASAVVDQAVAIARAAAERIARRAPSREDLADGAARISDTARDTAARAKPSKVDVKKAGQVAQLVPLTVALLKNPFVRDMLVRAAMRTTRRKK